METDHESGDEKEYDPTDDIPSDGSEFAPDLDASSDDDSVYRVSQKDLRFFLTIKKDILEFFLVFKKKFCFKNYYDKGCFRCL